MSRIILDELDKRILQVLASESRISTRRLAKILDKPVSTIYDRVKRLERTGVIEKYTIKVDAKKIGYQIKALILINVVGKHIEEVEEEISKHPNILTVLDITGEFDVAVIACFRNIDELDRFIKKLLKNPCIKQTRTSIAFRTVKEEINPPLME